MINEFLENNENQPANIKGRHRSGKGYFRTNPKKKIINNCCEEYEVLIDNSTNFETILKNLGFKMKGSIIKNREKIMYKDKYEFSFDNVQNIGSFVEVEVKKIEKDNITEIKELMKVLENLKIDLNSIENKRYFDYL